MTMLQAVLRLLGILAELAVICLVVLFFEKTWKWKGCSFDERQAQARGNAYRAAFWIGIGYYLFLMQVFGKQLDGMPPEMREGMLEIEPYLLVFYGILIEIAVVHIYCLLTHAALPLSRKPGWTIGLYLLWGVRQTLRVMADFRETQALPLVGIGCTIWVDLALAVLLFFLAAMHLLSLLIKDKED